MASYLEILRIRGVATMLAATLLARLPIGINHLAIVLFVRERTGSFAIAGAATGAMALGAGAGAPFLGRLIDRRGRRMLLRMATAHAAGLGALWALGAAGAPALALIAVSFLAGMAIPPASSVLRSMWPEVLRDRRELIQPAYALDSIVIELIFIGGPLLTAATVVLVGPEAALAISAGAVLGGTVAFVAQLSRYPEPARPAGGGLLGALASPAIRTLALASFPVGFCFGATEVALPAFGAAHGAAELAGVLIAIWALGSALGGIVYGARPRRAPLAHVHLGLATLLPLGFLPLAIASSPVIMALLVIPAGAVIAPLLASRNELVANLAPMGAATEAYTWPLTALVAGVAAGAALGGTIAEQVGWQAAFLCGSGVAAAGAAAVLARRETLQPTGEVTVAAEATA